MTCGKNRQKLKKILVNLAKISVPIFIGIVALSLTVGKDLMSNLTPSMTSFAVLNFIAYLFFIMMPIETLFFYYLYLGYSPLLLFSVCISCAIGAQIIDYAIGFFVSSPIINRFIGVENFAKFKKKIDKYGGLAIFVFNILPISSPIMMLTAGILKYDFKKAFFYSLVGLSLKTLAIIAFFYIFV